MFNSLYARTNPSEIPDSVYELICLLGEDGAGTRMRYMHWGYRWPEELEAVTAGENQVTLKEQRIALTSFARARKMRNVVTSASLAIGET